VSKNPHAVALGRKGGKVKSDAKTKAAGENIRKRWVKVKAQAERADE
jgi:hypothetical protein